MVTAGKKRGSNKGSGDVRGSGERKIESDSKAVEKRKGSGLLVFIASLVIVLIGLIQLLSAFHSYALNLSELNSLKRQEASLVAQKQDLENDIARWDDKAYVTAQARDRLGFVFPGEQAIRVEHPEAVTGVKPDEQSGETAVKTGQHKLPWYSELAFSLKKADTPLVKDEQVQQ